MREWNPENQQQTPPLNESSQPHRIPIVDEDVAPLADVPVDPGLPPSRKHPPKGMVVSSLLF